MFTGLVEKTGKLKSLTRRDGGGSLVIEYPEPWESSLVDGESVAVQGACLTVTGSDGGSFQADVLDETLDKTTLAALKSGDVLNLERALKVGDRMGGHIVSGHVDGVGSVAGISMRGRDRVLTVNCGSELAQQIVLKGSIAINGVSLTVTDVTDETFSVNIIPFTWEHTSFDVLKNGSHVNLETDIIGKYVQKYAGQAGQGSVTLEKLRNAGFA